MLLAIGSFLTLLILLLGLSSKWWLLITGGIMEIGARAVIVISIIYIIEVACDGVMGPVGI